MKLSLMQSSQKDRFDNLNTPEIAVWPLIKYLPPEKKIYWEPCDRGNSKFSEILRSLGNEVISTDIHTGFDFLHDSPSFHFDIIITNPPYSCKDDFLQKCFEYDKPFGLLLPLTALEGKRRGKLFRTYGIELLVNDSRFDYSGGGSNWFNTSYFCHNLLPDKLIFEQITKLPSKPLDSLTN
jgi:hypothetical protein